MEQPKWCNYPHAASPTFLGCWSLLDGLVKDESYCKDCDCYKRLKDKWYENYRRKSKSL